MRLSTPSGSYDYSDQSQTRALIEAEDAKNVKRNTSVSNVSFQADTDSAKIRTALDKMRETVSIKDNGAMDGRVNDAPAAQSLIDEMGIGVAVMPAGALNLGAGLSLGDGQGLRGALDVGCTIGFSPGADAACLTIDSGGAGASSQNQIENIGFFTADATHDLTAIKVIDGANVLLRKISIGQGNWDGAGENIGVHCLGRQMVAVEHPRIACPHPLLYSANPHVASLGISTDFFTVSKAELISTSATAACIEFEDGAFISDWCGDSVSLVGGLDGVRITGGANTTSSYKFSLRNFRVEQALDTAGYGFKANFVGAGGTNGQDIHLEVGYFDPGRKGLYLRGAKVVRLIGLTFPQTSGNIIDMLGISGSVLIMQGCIAESGATVSLNNMRCVYKTPPQVTGAPISEYELWVYDDGTVADERFVTENGRQRWSKGLTIANGVQTNLPITNALFPHGAGVSFTFNAERFAGTWYTGTLTGAAPTAGIEINAFTGGKIAILDAGGGVCTIINDSGSTKYIAIEATGVP